MRRNIGSLDRIFRVIIGGALVVWAMMGGPIWAWIGIIPLATAAFAFCPLYTLLGFSTCPLHQSKKPTSTDTQA